MKNFIRTLPLFLFQVLFSQQTLKTDFAVSYNVEYPIFKKKNTEQFLLFINTKENISYYRSANQYVLDSLSKQGKISNDDIIPSMSYDTALGEEVVRKNNIFTVYEKVVGVKLKYSEPVNLKWTIYKDKKIYVGYKTRKAVTIAYGRKWIAWYTEDLPLNFGPYKFWALLI